MKSIWISIISIGIILAGATLYAGGTYFIVQDESGYLIETSRDGTWSIFPDDITTPIKTGEKGNYRIRTDNSGTYIVTDRHGLFLIDSVAARPEDEEPEPAPAVLPKKTRVKIKGNRVLVPVLLSYNRRQVTVDLILDTGASTTLLHRKVADKLKIRGGKEALGRVAGGGTIKATRVALNYLQVGSLRKDNIVVSVVDHEGPPVVYSGLLGMDFLRGLDYRIDYEKQVINWNP